MLNVVAIMGRLVADPELRTTPQGINVCSFRIACDRNFARQGEQRQADFIDIVAWRQQAKLRSHAMRKLHTLVPLWVVRSSGSATRRPMIATTFNIIRTPFSSRKDYSSWATIRLRITPSVILYTRSSSAGKLGSAVKLITV